MLGVSLSTCLFTATKAFSDYVYILVMGRTGTGKTSFINTATDSHLAVGSALTSRTQSIQLSRPVQFGSRRVVLIDTPGLDDTSRSTEDVIRMVTAYVANMRKKGRIVQGAIYLHRISDNRMGQVALQSLRAFEGLRAQEALPHIAIVLSMWEDVPPNVRDERKKVLCERELYFRPLIEAGAVALAYERTHNSAHEVIQCVVKPTLQKLVPVWDNAGDPYESVLIHSRETSPIVVRLDNATSDIDQYREKIIGVELPMVHWKDKCHQARMGDPSSKTPRSGRIRRMIKSFKEFLCKSFRNDR
ncbi:P-loop containing nucleoside triphosphate hydrolase protein [Fomitopsis betulina]|nr:P-loop containing nucleoside triphosphate hydrolase protein [Fomitopsis betulina]